MPEPDTPLSERPWQHVERMLSVDEALAIILQQFDPLPPEETPLLEANGLVLTGSVFADEPIPPFRNSAMDGYAVRSHDTAAATMHEPAILRVIDHVAAGSTPTKRIAVGTAARVMTGAPMPEGADAVVRFEETTEGRWAWDNPRDRGVIGICRPAQEHDNVRLAGEDVAAGSEVLTSGTRLRPPELGMLAALNRRSVSVHRRPRVAILSTGDEIVDVGRPLRPGEIRNSNSYTLAAMVQRWGAVPLPIGVARDDVDDISNRLAAVHNADLIVTSGGVSVGDYDLVKDVLQAKGEVALWEVRMKPGKPLAFGQVGGRPLLGLPGNPVAAAVSLEVFGRPAVLRMLGRQDLTPMAIQARLAHVVGNRGQRRHFVRARVERHHDGSLSVRAAGEQGAGVLSSLCQANGLLIVPEDREVVEAGATVTVLMTDWDTPGSESLDNGSLLFGSCHGKRWWHGR